MESDSHNIFNNGFMNPFSSPSPPPPIRRQDSDITMINSNLTESETEDEDDDNCLDLTAAPQDDIFTLDSPTSSNHDSNNNNSNNTSPNPLDWLVEDGISEDQLVAMGIDIVEIRNQRDIEKRLEQEAQQLAYAKQLQDQINSESTPTDPPPSQSLINGNGKQPMERILPTSFDESSRKRPKLEPTVINEASYNNQAESSFSSSSSSSSSAPLPVYTIDSDDDLVDLTHEDSMDDDHEPKYYDLEEEPETIDDSDDDDVFMSSGNNNVEAILQQITLIRQRQEAQNRYGILMNPLAGLTGLEHLQQNLNVNYPPRPIASKAAVTTSIPAAVANNVSPRQAQQELQQLLASICDDEPPPPESRVGTPEGLKITLLEHQKVGFQWMSKQEASVNKGGMLTDDMGLGKTIQALAIIVSRRCQDAAALPDPMEMPHGRRKARMEPFKVKTTLVICPVSLMDQWAQEIKYKTENLSVHIHHGTNRLNDPYEVAKYDVIITSYHSATGEFPDDTSRGYTCLNPLIFHRVILDEAHTIKNRTTRAAKACYRINAIHRWCLTATPIQNKLEELFSLIYFLRIRPYCDWDRFRIDIVKPMKNPSSSTNKKVLKKVQVILKAIAIRRSKKAEIDGRPILNLPERNVHMTHVDFESEERQFYNYVDTRIQARFDQYVQSNTVMQNYSSVLVLLLRLRQACLHPSLTHIEKPVLKNDEDQQLESAESLDRKVVERLVNAKDELQTAECPICMDTADDARIIAGCGHILCRECLSAYISSGGNYGGPKTCPQCRGILQMDKTISVPIFIKIHIPELAKEEKKEEVVEEELENDLPSFESSKKIDTMLEILAKTRQESNDKTIIFSQFTSMLDVIERALERDGIKFGRYDGAMSLAGRTKVLENFHNDPAMDVLIVSTKCGSLGLNLTVANRVILMDVWWNPALENQAIDRVHRIGQTKDVHVHRLFINNTVEDRILELQRKKQAIADGAYGEGGAEKIGRLDLQDMLFLFRGDRGR